MEFVQEQRTLSEVESGAIANAENILKEYKLSEKAVKKVLSSLIPETVYSPILYALHNKLIENRNESKKEHFRRKLELALLPYKGKDRSVFSTLLSVMSEGCFTISDDGTKISYIKYINSNQRNYPSIASSMFGWAQEENLSLWLDPNFVFKFKENKIMDTIEQAKNIDRFLVTVGIHKYVTMRVKDHETITDHHIRDFCNFVIDCYKPPEIKEAASIEEIADVYNNGPHSCMSVSSGQDWSTYWKKFNMHPMEFYFYHPYTKVLYMKRGGAIVARGVAFELPDNNKYIGRTYASSGQDKADFLSALKDKGYNTDYEGRYNIPHSVTFEMPAKYFYDSSRVVIPVPYMDNIRNGVDINIKKSESGEYSIKVEIDSKGDCEDRRNCNMDPLTPRGYAILSLDNKQNNITCSYCEKRCRDNVITIQDEPGLNYCSERHAFTHGAGVIYNTDGTKIYLRNKRDADLILAGDDINHPRRAEFIGFVGFSTLNSALRACTVPVFTSNLREKYSFNIIRLMPDYVVSRDFMYEAKRLKPVFLETNKGWLTCVVSNEDIARYSKGSAKLNSLDIYDDIPIFIEQIFGQFGDIELTLPVITKEDLTNE